MGDAVCENTEPSGRVRIPPLPATARPGLAGEVHQVGEAGDASHTQGPEFGHQGERGVVDEAQAGRGQRRLVDRGTELPQPDSPTVIDRKYLGRRLS